MVEIDLAKMSSAKRKKTEPTVKVKTRTVLHYFSSNRCETRSNEGSTDDSATQAEGDSLMNMEHSDIETNDPKPAADESESSDRVFQNKWLSLFSWLTFNDKNNVMQCSLCLKHQKMNTFTEGTSNFRTSTLTRHANGKDHKAAILAENMKTDFAVAIKNVTNEKENAMRSVYWLAKDLQSMNSTFVKV